MKKKKTNLRRPEDASLLGRKMVVFTVWLFLCPRLRMRRWMCRCQADEAGGQGEEDGGEEANDREVDNDVLRPV